MLFTGWRNLVKPLEIKTAFLDAGLNITDRNKEFYSYFEKAGLLYSHADEIVSESQKDDFKSIIRPGSSGSFRAFKFKKNNGEEILNVVWLDKPDDKSILVKIAEIPRIISFVGDAALYEKQMHTALGIASDYLFTYCKSTNIVTLQSFLQGHNTVLYEQDIDSWKTQVVTEGLIEKTDEAEFESKINELKECNPDFSMTVSSSIRFSLQMFEKLVFSAKRIKAGNEVYMVGRILPEVFVERSEKSDKFLNEIKFDSLTGVYNKKAILNLARNRFAEGTKENAVLAIVDLDHFKSVNDAYGHLAGDKVLEKAGEILRKITGEGGVVGRYGGDEFLLILEDMNDEITFRGVFQIIISEMRAAFKDMFTDIKVTVSIGSALYPKDGKTFAELFKKADFCLYRAKDKGRDRYVFFREDLHGELYKKASEAKTEGIKYDVREVLELKSMAAFMLDLEENPKPAAETVLKHMLATYNLDAITIFYGDGVKRRYFIGKDPDELKEAGYIKSAEFKNALNGRPYIRIDFTTEMDECAKPFGKILDGRGIKSSIQCILGTKDNPQGLITFDRLREGALWAEYEVNCCVMFAATVNLLPQEKLLKIFS